MPSFLVTNTFDSGVGSLREAIDFANADPDVDTIEFDGISGTISLSSGELYITEALTIQGPGASLLSISGNDLSRIFTLDNAGDVIIDGLTLTNGFSDYGGAINIIDSTLTISNSVLSGNNANIDGGAIFNDYGNLTITESIITGNIADENAGAINNFNGYLSIFNSTLSNNQAVNDDGGAIDNDGGAVLIQSSTLSGNQAGDDGGVIENAYSSLYTGDLIILDSTLSGNVAGDDGGAIDNDAGSLRLANVTIYENTSRYGGGLFNGDLSQAIIINTTISGNSAQEGGGIFNDGDNNYSGLIDIGNTIIANTVSGGDCVNRGDINENINNLIEDGSCNPLLSGDPNLGPLQDNGGPTLTQALLPGSIAIDAGNTSILPNFLIYDQRGAGYNRVSGTEVDIGAFEVQGIETVPEPSAMMGLIILAIAGVSRWRRRR